MGPDLKVQFPNNTEFLVPNKRASDKLSIFFRRHAPLLAVLGTLAISSPTRRLGVVFYNFSGCSFLSII